MNKYEEAYENVSEWLGSLTKDEADAYFLTLRKKFDHMMDDDSGVTYVYLNDEESDWLDPDAVSPEAAQS